MPTYGYKCAECADTFEVLQKMSDDALTVCEKCGGKLKKLLYPVGISFKGDGFYVTDYKGAGKDPKASKETTTETTTGTAAPATTDGKPAEGASSSATETKSEAKPSDNSPKVETKTETKPAVPETKPAVPETKPAAKPATS